MDDKVLKRMIEDELEWEPRVDATSIGVIVENGIVRLEGHVPTYFEKMEAEKAVKRVKGVRGLVEELNVDLFEEPTGDESIATHLANSFDWDAALPKGAITIKVEHGIVTLGGQVDWQFQRNNAESKAKGLFGVRQVINQINLKPHAQASDLKHRIEDALKRQAQIDSDNISVTVDGDKVQLNGRVKAWFERDAIERAVWAASGVRTVEDHVRIGT